MRARHALDLGVKPLDGRLFTRHQAQAAFRIRRCRDQIQRRRAVMDEARPRAIVELEHDVLVQRLCGKAKFREHVGLPKVEVPAQSHQPGVGRALQQHRVFRDEGGMFLCCALALPRNKPLFAVHVLFLHGDDAKYICRLVPQQVGLDPRCSPTRWHAHRHRRWFLTRVAALVGQPQRRAVVVQHQRECDLFGRIAGSRRLTILGHSVI